MNDMMREQREPFPDSGHRHGIGPDRSQLLHDQRRRCARGDSSIRCEHFCRYGWRESRKPNIYFDMRWYLQTNTHVDRLRINPVVHYICEGEMAGRRPVPYFDPLWYRETYTIPPGQGALAHFLTHRRSQAFSPTPLFDVGWYVEQHPEELTGNRDPFAHFLQAGTYRDIDPSPAFDTAAYRKRHLGRPEPPVPPPDAS